MTGARPSGVRLAELVGALSLAVDLGLGQPMEHVARSCLLACRLGSRIGLDEADRAALYYTALLGWVGCIADSHEASKWFGDDIDYRAGVFDVDTKPLPFLGYLVRRAGTGAPPVQQAGAKAVVAVTGAHALRETLRSHCQVTAAIAGRLGLGPDVRGPLGQIFARWDGKGLPAGLAGDRIAIAVRLWHVADVTEVHHRHGGLDAARKVVADRRGGHFDPAIAAEFLACAPELFAGLPEGSSWDDLIAAEPALRPALSEGELDRALEVLADYADLKAPHLRGHSRGVSALAAAAAARLGVDTGLVRRAALVHDLGRIGIPTTIWEKPGPLTAAERERVRLCPHYTDRMLARPPALASIGAVAALAYERLDGSGHHRGLPAAAIPMPARVLAAADCYHAMTEARPHRAALTASAAAKELRAEASAGRLDSSAVDAVLACAGHRPSRRPAGPAGLTPRETDVLALLARGASNRQIARRLGISPKTAGNHIEHIYAKTGVSTRAAATLFAMEHGLLNHGANTP